MQSLKVPVMFRLAEMSLRKVKSASHFGYWSSWVGASLNSIIVVTYITIASRKSIDRIAMIGIAFGLKKVLKLYLVRIKFITSVISFMTFYNPRFGTHIFLVNRAMKN